MFLFLSLHELRRLLMGEALDAGADEAVEVMVKFEGAAREKPCEAMG